MKSLDAAEGNVAKIAGLFPQCVTERIGKNCTAELAIDFDKLRDELSKDLLDGAEERYQFTWPDKRAASRLANEATDKTLRPDLDASEDFWNTKNLYIEGDNLDVLKVLRENYLGAIKMIYIDPPYNTGNDFVYNDDFAQSREDFEATSGAFDEEGNQLIDPMQRNTESNGRFHTDWLNMIFPRLKVARDLLSDDGVILINMDENEILNLSKVCSEIFGESNHVGTIIWDKRNPKGDARGISYQHENIIIYAKDIGLFKEVCKLLRPKKNATNMLQKAKKLFSKINTNYSLEEANEDFALWLSQQPSLSGGEKAYNRIDENGEVYQSVSMAWPNKKQAPDEYFIPLIHPVTGRECVVPPRGWRNPPKTMSELLAKGLIIFGPDERTQPRRKYLLSENMYENIPSLLYFGGSDVELLKSLDIPFDTPKVVDVCKEHIQSLTSKDSIILDFFSGSATTAHAVMKLNAEDGGKRKFIMVQLPEVTDEKSEARKAGYETICQIGEERIRRAGKHIMEELKKHKGNISNKEDNGLFELELSKGQQITPPEKELPDIGFRVLKLDSSNMEDVFYTPEDFDAQNIFTTVDNVKSDRTPLDLLFQVLPELNIELSAKIEEKEINGKKVFFVDDNYLIATFDNEVNESTVTEIAKMKPQYFVMRDASAANDNVLDNFEQIFRHYSPDTIRKIL